MAINLTSFSLEVRRNSKKENILVVAALEIWQKVTEMGNIRQHPVEKIHQEETLKGLERTIQQIYMGLCLCLSSLKCKSAESHKRELWVQFSKLTELLATTIHMMSHQMFSTAVKEKSPAVTSLAVVMPKEQPRYSSAIALSSVINCIFHK